MQVPTLETRIQPVEEDGLMAVLVVGKPTVEFGSEVNVEVVGFGPTRYHYDQYVHGIDSLPANELSTSVVQLFGYYTIESLIEGLTRAYGTGLPANVQVTIYTLSNLPVEFHIEEVR